MNSGINKRRIKRIYTDGKLHVEDIAKTIDAVRLSLPPYRPAFDCRTPMYNARGGMWMWLKRGGHLPDMRFTKPGFS